MKNIKTGVDKLVDLVYESKKIKLSSAAKELGVSEDTIKEWAEFLEQEGRVSINYGFFGITLEKVEGSKQEIIEAGKKLISEKDVFRRKIESTINKLSQETADFEEIKKEYKKIHKQVKNEIENVKKDVEELKKFENLKKNLDKEIQNQKDDYTKESSRIKKLLEKDEDKFDDLNSRINKKIVDIEKEEKQILDLEKKKEKISEFIISGKKKLDDLGTELKEINNSLIYKKRDLENMKVEFTNLNQEVGVDKKKSVVNLINWIEKERFRIQKEQDALLKEAHYKTKVINKHKENGDVVLKSFKGYFTKKINIENKIDEIENDIKSLNQNLDKFKQKLNSYVSLKTNKEVKKFEKDIRTKLDEYEKQRNGIRRKIENLIDQIRG